MVHGQVPWGRILFSDACACTSGPCLLYAVCQSQKENQTATAGHGAAAAQHENEPSSPRSHSWEYRFPLHQQERNDQL